MSDPRWKSLLAPESYAVLFEEATERPGSSAAEPREAEGDVHLRRLSPAAVLVRREVR